MWDQTDSPEIPDRGETSEEEKTASLRGQTNRDRDIERERESSKSPANVTVVCRRWGEF